MDKFPLLKLFKNIHIEELPELDVYEKKTAEGESDIQIVSKTLKEINYNNINDIKKEKEILKPEECQRIIKDNFCKFWYNNEGEKYEYNYYHLINFIKFLSHEYNLLKGFVLLDEEKAIERKIEVKQPTNKEDLEKFQKEKEQNENNISWGKKYIRDIKKDIIKYIKNTAIFFNKGPYDKLIKSQKESLIDYKDLSEKEIDEQAINSLVMLQESVTDFNNIPNILFIFNEDKSTFTPIIKEKDNDYNKISELIKKFSG